MDAILASHGTKRNQPFVLLESAVISVESGTLTVRFPAWLDALFDALKETHGTLQAPFILSHCMEALLSHWVRMETLTPEGHQVLMTLIDAKYHPGFITATPATVN